MAIGPVKQAYLDRVKAAQQQRSEADPTIEEGKQATKQARRRRFRQQVAAPIPKQAPPSTIFKSPSWARRPIQIMGPGGRRFGGPGRQKQPKGRTLSGGKGFQREFHGKVGWQGVQLVSEGRTEPRQQKRTGLGRTGLGQFGTAMERFSKIGRATRRASPQQMQFEPGKGIVRGPTEAKRLQSRINAVKKDWARNIAGSRQVVGEKIVGARQVGEDRDFREEIFGSMGKSGSEKEIEAYGQLSARARQGYMPPRMGPIKIAGTPEGTKRRDIETYKNWEKWRVQQQNDMKKAFRDAGVPPTPGPGSHKRVTPRPPILDKSGRISEESYETPASKQDIFGLQGWKFGAGGTLGKAAKYTSKNPYTGALKKGPPPPAAAPYQVGGPIQVGPRSRARKRLKMSSIASSAAANIRQSFAPTMSTQLFGK